MILNCVVIYINNRIIIIFCLKFVKKILILKCYVCGTFTTRK